MLFWFALVVSMSTSILKFNIDLSVDLSLLLNFKLNPNIVVESPSDFNGNFVITSDGSVMRLMRLSK